MSRFLKWSYRISTAWGLYFLYRSTLTYDGWWSYYAFEVILMALLKMFLPRASKQGIGFPYRKHAIFMVMLSISMLNVIPHFFSSLTNPKAEEPNYQDSGELFRAISLAVYVIVIWFIVTSDDEYVWEQRDRDDLDTFYESDFEDKDAPTSGDEQRQKKLHSKKVSFSVFHVNALEKFLKRFLQYLRVGEKGEMDEENENEEHHHHHEGHHHEGHEGHHHHGGGHGGNEHEAHHHHHLYHHHEDAIWKQEEQKQTADLKQFETQETKVINESSINGQQAADYGIHEGYQYQDQNDVEDPSITSTLRFTDSTGKTSTTASSTSSSSYSTSSFDHSFGRSTSSFSSYDSGEETDDDVATPSSDLLSEDSSNISYGDEEFVHNESSLSESD